MEYLKFNVEELHINILDTLFRKVLELENTELIMTLKSFESTFHRTLLFKSTCKSPSVWSSAALEL